MKLISHCLTPIHRLSGIQSLIGFGNLSVPNPFSALPPVILYKASPKAISGRTSYLRVRLEFLRYPHLIRHLFNEGRFGPPWRFTATSPWTWIGHQVSGPMNATLKVNIVNPYALFGLGLPSAPDLKSLTSLHPYARRTVLQKVPHHALTRFVCL